MRLVWQKIRAMSNKFHREEMSNVYKEEHMTQVATQIDELSPPWCAVRPPLFERCPIMRDMCRPFTLVELKSALMATRTRSAPGTDGIDYCILRKLPTEFKEYLLCIYNTGQISLYPYIYYHTFTLDKIKYAQENIYLFLLVTEAYNQDR